jgi:hypothetical protein
MFAPPICRRRCGTALFRSVSSDEGGGNPANIAASGASNQISRAMREQLQKKSNRIDAYLVCGRKSVFYASCERRHT